MSTNYLKAAFTSLWLIGIILIACDSGMRTEDSNSSDSEKADQIRKTNYGKKIYSINGIHFDGQFDGGHIDHVESINDSSYRILILPENEPINKSPWYAFKLSSDQPKKIYISLDYQKYKHRYIPKLSLDGKKWKKYALPITLNADSTLATFPVDVFEKTLWISSQEIVSSNDMITWMDSITSTRKFLKQDVVGKTVQGRNIHVISSEDQNIKKSMVLIARQHPPEVPGGTIAFKAFLDELVQGDQLAIDFRDRCNLYVFPLLNPDGVDLGHWRHNANGADLNRDWIEFMQPETRAVKQFLETKVSDENKQIVFGIDFHTSHSGPYLLILDSLNERRLNTRFIPNWIGKIDQEDLVMEYRRRSQELPYCYNWFYQAFGAEAVTYEDGDEIDRETIEQRARHYAGKLMEVMVAKSDDK